MEVVFRSPLLRVVQVGLKSIICVASDTKMVEAESVAKCISEKGKVMVECFGMNFKDKWAQRLKVSWLSFLLGWEVENIAWNRWICALPTWVNRLAGLGIWPVLTIYLTRVLEFVLNELESVRPGRMMQTENNRLTVSQRKKKKTGQYFMTYSQE